MTAAINMTEELLMFSGCSPHLGQQFESQVWERSDEVPHIVEPTCHFCYFKEAPWIKTIHFLVKN